MATTRNFAEVIRHQLANDPELRADVDEAHFHAEVGRLLYANRKNLRMTKKALAEKLGLTVPKITAIEEADYPKLDIRLVNAIARAFGKELAITFRSED